METNKKEINQLEQVYHKNKRMSIINYLGSKVRLSGWITNTIKKTIEIDGLDISNMKFCEPFAGTGIISRLMANEVKSIVANDIEYYSYILNSTFLMSVNNVNLDLIKVESLIDTLNSLVPVTGMIYRNYCSPDDTSLNGARLYFKSRNGAKIDAIRQHIRFLFRSRRINVFERFFLISSLIMAADKVSNCASMYGAYLKDLKSSAMRDLQLEMPIVNPENPPSSVFWMDARNLLTMVQGDILYIDPPYNKRQYGANYHLLNTIALYDDFKLIPKGKTGLRPDYNKSAWCYRAKCEAELDELISLANYNFIFMSYNDQGLIDDPRAIMNRYGRCDVISRLYNTYKSDNNRVYKKDPVERLYVLRKYK